MNRTALSQVGWILSAAVLGFASAFLFGDVLGLSRRLFLVPHAVLTLAFLVAYARWSGVSISRFWKRRLRWGIVGAMVVGAGLVVNVQGQPASAHPSGWALVADVLWLGLVYGCVDALLLSAFPVVAVWRACRTLGFTSRLSGRIAAGVLGIVASLFVTSAYHVGFAEFRGRAVGKPMVGNGLVSLGQILSGSPVAATGSHVIMHVAAVLHGAESTVQLPPHR